MAFNNNSTTANYTKSSGTLPSGTSDHTVMMWVNPQTLTNSWRLFIMNYTDPGTAYTNLFILNTGLIRYRERDNAVETTATGTTALSTGTWYHVAITLATNAMTAYLNGVSEATGTKSSPASRSTGTSFTIGTNNANAYGYISHFRWLEGIALTGTQIKEMYNSERCRRQALFDLPFWGSDVSDHEINLGYGGNMSITGSPSGVSGKQLAGGTTPVIVDQYQRRAQPQGAGMCF